MAAMTPKHPPKNSPPSSLNANCPLFPSISTSTPRPKSSAPQHPPGTLPSSSASTSAVCAPIGRSTASCTTSWPTCSVAIQMGLTSPTASTTYTSTTTPCATRGLLHPVPQMENSTFSRRAAAKRTQLRSLLVAVSQLISTISLLKV